jgi:hypothetical protein
MASIEIIKANEVYIKVYSDFNIESEIKDYFTFKVPGHQFSPKFRARMWDGTVSLYNIKTKTLPIGLYPRLEEYCKDSGIDITFKKCDRFDAVVERFDQDEIDTKHFVDDLKLASKSGPITARDYQITAIHKAITDKRVTLISPTSSGKSAIIYSTIRWILSENPGSRVLLIVPNVSLVNQMMGDFREYSTENGWDVDEHCQRLFGGQSKDLVKDVLITTWQSFSKISKDKVNGPKILSLYKGVIVDECFSGDSKILMSDGSWKPIKDVAAGDLVKNISSTGEVKTDRVIKQHQNLRHSKSYDMFELEFDNGQTVNVTGNHKVMVGINVWKPVDELVEGDEILDVGDIV